MRLHIREENLGNALSRLDVVLQTQSIDWPQVLGWEEDGNGWIVLVSGSEKTMKKLKFALKDNESFQLDENDSPAADRGHAVF